jgi:hypothetical protein
MILGWALWTDGRRTSSQLTARRTPFGAAALALA